MHSMKAAVYYNYGGPEVLKIEEADQPLPSENEVLIRVRAATANRTDCANLTAIPFFMRLSLGLSKPRKNIMGTEFAGEIAEVGSNVVHYKVGDKVFGFFDGGLGSYGQYISLPVDDNFDLMPDGISFEQAAASSEGAHYAYNFINKVDLKAGDHVLVNGASGGIGSAAVQLLHHFGAVVTAVGNSASIERLEKLGVRKAIDYTKADFTQDMDRYEFVFDTAGKSTFGKCKHLLKPGGVYISSELGPWSQNVLFSLGTLMFGSMPGQKGKKVKFPYPPNIKWTLQLVRKLTNEGKFAPLIDRTYDLSEISETFSYVLKGHKTGNVVIKMP